MTQEIQKVNGPTAPLKNVVLFLQLIRQLDDRPPHLPGIGCFYGLSGYGKTYSAIHGANKSDAVYVECGDSWSKSTLADAILHEVAGHEIRATIAVKIQKIIDILEVQPRPLIIDEADHLVKKSMIEIVRQISDRSAAPVILIGEQQLPGKLLEFERVHNRVLQWIEAQKCDLEDARHLVGMYLPNISISDDLLSQLVTDTKGCTRRVVINLEQIKQHCLSEGMSVIDKAAWAGRPIFTGEPIRRTRARRAAVRTVGAA